jgi:hypothetical protein
LDRCEGLIIFVWPLATPLWSDLGYQSSQGHIVFEGNAFPERLPERIRAFGNLGPVLIGDVHEVLEEGLDMH